MEGCTRELGIFSPTGGGGSLGDYRNIFFWHETDATWQGVFALGGFRMKMTLTIGELEGPFCFRTQR